MNSNAKSKPVLACFFFLIIVLTPVVLYAKCEQVTYPLSTKQQFIIDAKSCKVLLKSVNWFGAESQAYIPGGLDQQPLQNIVNLIKKGGFNSVRLPWSNEMVSKNPVVIIRLLKANPQLQGKTALAVFDAVINAIGQAGLMVILDNHRSRADWCCDKEHGDGLWFSKEYPAELFFKHWQQMTARYKDKPFVVASELRNEIRPDSIIGLEPDWGSKNPRTDWHMAATKAGNLIHRINPNVLIVVGGLRWQENLEEVKKMPVKLDQPGKLVYAAHDYVWYHSPEELSDFELFKKSADRRWDFVLEPEKTYTAPVYLSEWGGCTQVNADDSRCPENRYKFVEMFTKYLCSVDENAPVSWAYWALNGNQLMGYSRTEGAVETYGLLKPDWQTWASPQLINQLTGDGCKILKSNGSKNKIN